jgi:IS30 family transposase
MGRRVRGRTWWMTPADRVVIERRLRAGERPRVIAADFGCHRATVNRVRTDLFLRRRVSDSGFRLSFEERIDISIRAARGESNAEIARGLGRHRSTIGRELARCRSRGRYRPLPAQRRADRLARRPKPTRLAANPGLLAAVEEGFVSGLVAAADRGSVAPQVPR